MARSVIALLAFFMFAAQAPAFAEKRVALVIGNGGYAHATQLSNPSRDAQAMAKLFRDARFDDVTVETDLSVTAMRRALRTFADKTADADTAVVFYAGHGVEIGGRNYLIPVDARLATDIDVEDEAVDLDRVLQLLSPARRLKLIILDACRENPFARGMRMTTASRSVGRGLAPPSEQTSDTLVAYAAKAGAIAADGDGANSPFTTALLHNLTQPGLDVRIALGQAHDEVLRATGRRQEPFLYGALGGGMLPLAPGGDPAPPASDSQQAEFDSAMSAGTVAALDGFLARYTAGPLANTARREREKLQRPQVAAIPAAPPLAVTSGSCGGVTLASLGSRSPAPLSVNEECALKPKAEFRECKTCPTMVVIPAGSFTMGSSKDESWVRSEDEGPQHDVTIPKPFAVGKFHVTVQEFKAFIATTGYDAGSSCGIFSGGEVKDSAGRSWRHPGFAQADSHPVSCVSWKDAQAYADWMSKTTGKNYRLLSESEWEYAARGQTSPGTYPKYHFGNSEEEMCRYGNGLDVTAKRNTSWAKNYEIFSCSDGASYTSPVGSYAPNAFGLHNMHGNLSQWTAECYHESYDGAPNDGSAWTDANCNHRVQRGGSWFSNPPGLRAASRNRSKPNDRNVMTGFRLARTLIP